MISILEIQLKNNFGKIFKQKINPCVQLVTPQMTMPDLHTAPLFTELNISSSDFSDNIKTLEAIYIRPALLVSFS